MAVGYDTDSDGDINDLMYEETFSATSYDSTQITYDHNGNLTSDGNYDFIYDAFNRLVEGERGDRWEPREREEAAIGKADRTSASGRRPGPE